MKTISICLLLLCWSGGIESAVIGKKGPPEKKGRKLATRHRFISLKTLSKKMTYTNSQLQKDFSEFSTLEENSDKKVTVLFAIDARLRENNRLLKRYVDDYILTPKVILAYNNYLRQHDNTNKGSINEALRFFIKTFHEVKLRKFEKDVFSAVKDYQIGLKTNGPQLKSWLESHKSPLDVYTRFKRAGRLLSFVKKYMGFILNLKSYFHYLDFEEGQTDHVQIDEDYYRLNHKDAPKEAESSNKLPPLTVMIGNDDTLTKPADLVPPSEVIESGEPSDVFIHPIHLAVSPEDQLAFQHFLQEQAAKLKEKEFTIPISESFNPQSPFSLNMFKDSQNQSQTPTPVPRQLLSLGESPEDERLDVRDLNNPEQVPSLSGQEQSPTKASNQSTISETTNVVNSSRGGFSNNVHILKAPQIVKQSSTPYRATGIEGLQNFKISNVSERGNEAAKYANAFNQFFNAPWQETKEALRKNGVKVSAYKRPDIISPQESEKKTEQFIDQVLKPKMPYIDRKDFFGVRKLMGSDPMVERLDNVYKNLLGGII